MVNNRSLVTDHSMVMDQKIVQSRSLTMHLILSKYATCLLPECESKPTLAAWSSVKNLLYIDQQHKYHTVTESVPNSLFWLVF